MAARSIASATISFGLVSVPVNVYSSSESKASVSFNMLHKDCGGRLKQHYTCTKDNSVVTRDNTVKGYEFAKDQYVILTPEELKALEEKATSTIDIVEFVPMSEVDRVYLDKVYYLGPDKGGDRAYRLLVEALKTSGKAALGQYAARGQQHLVLLRARDGVLVMEQLHYADEIRPPTEVPIPTGEVKDAELKLAMLLIDQTANESFEPQDKATYGNAFLEIFRARWKSGLTSDVAPSNGVADPRTHGALKASLARSPPEKRSARTKSVGKLLAGRGLLHQGCNERSSGRAEIRPVLGFYATNPDARYQHIHRLPGSTCSRCRACAEQLRSRSSDHGSRTTRYEGRVGSLVAFLLKTPRCWRKTVRFFSIFRQIGKRTSAATNFSNYLPPRQNRVVPARELVRRRSFR